MVTLSPKSVTETMIDCYDHYGLEVGIAFSTQKRMMDFALSMQQQYRDGLVPSVFYRQGINTIYFDTGSSIRLFNGSDLKNAYGRDFDLVVIDPDIVDEDVIEYLKLCERRHFKKRLKNAECMEVDPEPLDKFLSEFIITKP